jgi:hypothetical protein
LAQSGGKYILNDMFQCTGITYSYFLGVQARRSKKEGQPEANETKVDDDDDDDDDTNES